MVVRGVGGPEPIKPSKNTEKVERAKGGSNAIGSDEVSISEDARQILNRKQAKEIALSTVRNLPDIRPSAVERGKRFIESGEYKSEKAIDNVSKKLGEEIVTSLFIRKEDGV